MDEINEHPGGVRTYHTQYGWSIADLGGWVPGLYDSEETALAALDHLDSETAAGFYEMQKRINHVDQENRLITRADLKALRGRTVEQ